MTVWQIFGGSSISPSRRAREGYRVPRGARKERIRLVKLVKMADAHTHTNQPGNWTPFSQREGNYGGYLTFLLHKYTFHLEET